MSSLINNDTSSTKRQFFRLKITRKCITLCIKNVYVSDTIHNLNMFYITQPNDIIITNYKDLLVMVELISTINNQRHSSFNIKSL